MNSILKTIFNKTTVQKKLAINMSTTKHATPTAPQIFLQRSASAHKWLYILRRIITKIVVPILLDVISCYIAKWISA